MRQHGSVNKLPMSEEVCMYGYSTERSVEPIQATAYLVCMNLLLTGGLKFHPNRFVIFHSVNLVLMGPS